MILKATVAALALLTAANVPAVAQMSAGNSSMMSNDHMMAAKPMKPMSKADKAMMMKCQKMSAAMMKKNAKCSKMMAMHSGAM